jgi:NAD(P)-dependent dehydrogenase (short-subunit alcohol dehydrogenase family)
MNIVITGATGAIGSALAAILHARGDSLLLCGRDAAKLGSLNASLEGAHNTLVADLATADGLTLLQAKAADLGMMEGVAHCVGSTVVRPLHLTSEKDWHDQIATNATSAFHVLKWFVLQATKAQRPAVAVMTSSVVAEAGFANHEAIAAAKCAVTGLARSDSSIHRRQKPVPRRSFPPIASPNQATLHMRLPISCRRMQVISRGRSFVWTAGRAYCDHCRAW